MSLLSTEELNDLRQQVLAGKEFSVEEYKRIIQSYRAARLGAVAGAAPKVTAKAEAKAKAAPVELNTLLAGLGLAKKE